MTKDIIIWDQKYNFKSENINANDLIIFWNDDFPEALEYYNDELEVVSD